MAAKKPEQHSVILRFAYVYWPPKLNKARPSGFLGNKNQLEQLEINLATNTWLKNEGGSSGLIEAEEMWGEWAAEAVKAREQRYGYLKEEAKTNTALQEDVDVFERVFMDKGKIIVPRYIGVTGNRRASVFFKSMCRRSKMTDPDTGKKLEIDDTLPAVIVHYESDEQRLMAQTRENEFRNRDALDSSPIDQLAIAKQLMQLGASQNKLRNTFSSPGIGVKYFYVVQLDSKFPNLRILERCGVPVREGKMDLENGIQMKPDDPTFIPLPSVQHPMLQSMGQRYTPEDTDAYNTKNSSKSGFKIQPVLTEDEVREYFEAGVKNPAGNAKTMANKNVVFGLATNNDNPIIKSVAKAIHDNQLDSLKDLTVIAPGCEALMNLKGEGDYPVAEQILVALYKAKKGKQRNDLEQRLLAVLEV